MKSDHDLRSENRSLRIRNQALTRELRIARDKDRQMTRLTDVLYRRFAEGNDLSRRRGREFDGLSFVIAAHNIPRQLQRTLLSCSPYYQSIQPLKVEVIIVDNGSDVPLERVDFNDFPRVTKVIRIDGRPSPVFAMNRGISEASFSNVALMIDGAHMLTPGVVRNAKAVIESMPRPVIGVPQYLLGPTSQNLRRVPNPFEREAEDLKQLGWPDNGYGLFDYAVMVGEWATRHYLDAIESNCLITSKEVLRECGGLDERFDEAGAGLANIELFTRLTHEPRNQYVMLPGEGSFHQDHGGVTTSVSTKERDRLVKAYLKKFKSVTGYEKNLNVRAPFVFGEVSVANRMVPTISREYGEARALLTDDLAEIYIDRARTGVDGRMPALTLKPIAAEKHRPRPLLEPLGIARGEQVPPYRRLLRRIHEGLRPRRYLEIGVDDGASLSLARCPSIGVDPSFEITCPLQSPVRIFRMSSDAFFDDAALCQDVFSGDAFDLAFIDGMHLAEYVLRDFINVERRLSGHGIIVVDDVYPEQLAMADRRQRYNAWCGDVYKIVPVLREYRPDLDVRVYPASAGPYRKGLAVIGNLDGGNATLAEHVEDITRDILDGKYTISAAEALDELLPVEPVERLDGRIETLRRSAA